MKPICLYLLLILVYLRHGLSAQYIRRIQQQHDNEIGCSTPDHDVDDNNRAHAVAKLLHSSTKGYQANTPKVIRVCFHVVGKRISRSTLRQELDALNRAFSTESCCNTDLPWCPPSLPEGNHCSAPETNLRFVMARGIFGHILPGTARTTCLFSCVRRRFRSTDMTYQSEGELQVKQAMRQGDAQVLNVYYANLEDSSAGYARPPEQSQYFLELDGVVLHRNQLGSSGGSSTLAHQVGHWLGLVHTWQGGCAAGDGIADTPSQLTPGTACEATVPQDTCPDQTGVDPIHNYMDTNNSEEECRFQWTQGQIDVMHAVIDFYRQKTPPLLPMVDLTLGEYSESYTLATGFLRQFRLQLSQVSTVYCKVHATGGNVGLLANYDGKLDHFVCHSHGFYPQEICVLGPRVGAIYLFVDASATTVDFTVFCDTTDTSSAINITADVPATGIQLSKGTLQPYTVQFDNFGTLESFGTFECTTKTTSGNTMVGIDLHTDSTNAMTGFTCHSQTPNTASQKCTSIVTSDKGYVWLYAVTSASDVTLDCQLSPLDAEELTGGVPFSSQTILWSGMSQFFYMNQADISGVECETSGTGTSGDIDLYLSWNDPFVPECSTENQGSDESCTLTLNSGFVFARVSAFETIEGFTIKCTAFPIPIVPLTSGATSGPHSSPAEGLALFTLEVEESSMVTCETEGTDGDLDLYMNWDGSSNYVCISISSGTSMESCTIGPNEGTAYAFTRAFRAPVSNYTITCTATAV